MIALTQERKIALIEHADEIKDRLSEYGYPFQPHKTKQLLYIALASLTAEPVLHAVDSDVEDKLYTVLCNEHEDGSYPLFTAPPVPEINKDSYIGLQVSVDVSTCDDDAGHRYFGIVSTITESKGEVVLVVEEPEKNFTAPPLPEIKGYTEPHAQYSEGVVDGYNRCLADINRLNGLGE